MSKVKKVLIGLAILFVLAVILLANSGESELVKDEPVVAPEPVEEPANPVLGGKPKYDLFEDCKAQIKQQLNRPASLDASLLSLALADVENSKHVMWFDFTAKNAFDAEIKYSAKCYFASGNGALLSAEIVEPL